MPKKGNQLNLFVGFELSKDSDKNYQKLIQQTEQIQNAGKRQAELVTRTGKPFLETGKQMRLFRNVTMGTTRDIVANTSAFKTMSSGVAETNPKLIQVTEQLKSAGTQQKNLGKSTQKTGDQLNMFYRNLQGNLVPTTNALNQKKKTTNETEKALKNMGLGLTMVAWHLRFLGNMLTRVGQQMIRFVSNAVRAGADLQDAFFGLNASVSLAGESIEEANEVVENFGKRGIMAMSSAISNLNRLMITNSMSISEAEDAMKRYLDVGALASDNQDEIAKSMEAMTKAIIKGTTTLSTDPALLMVWGQMEIHAENVHKKTLKQLTMEQRAALFRKTLAEDFGGLAGLHEARLGLITAQLVRLTEVQQIMSLAFTNSMHPAILVVVDAVVAFSDVLKSILDRMGALFPALVIATIAMVTFFGAVFTATAAMISMAHIKKQMALMFPVVAKGAATSAAATAKLGISAKFTAVGVKALTFAMHRMVPILFILSSVVTLGAYLWMRYSGAIDRSKKSADMASQGVEKLRNELLKLTEGTDDSKAEKDRERAHKRRLEDLEEELARERSKGLWADQLKIKDLQKRIAREKEDYAHAQKDKESGDKSGLDKYKDLMDDLFSVTEDTTEGIENLWKNMWDEMSNKAKLAIAGIIGIMGISALLKALGYGSLGAILLSKIKVGVIAAGKWLAGTGAVKLLGKLAAGILGSKFILAAVLLAIAAWIIYSLWDEIKTFIIELPKKIKEWLDKNGFEDVGEAIAYYMTIGIDKIKTYIEKLNTKIEEWLDKNGFEDVGEAIGTYLHTGIVKALKILNTLHEKVNTWLIEQDWNVIGIKIGTWIGNAIVSMFKTLWSLPTLTIEIVKWLIESDWSKIGDAISGFLKKSFIRNMLALFTGGLSEAMYTEINKDKEGYGKIGTEIARHIVNRIKSYFSLGNIILDLTRSIGSAIKTSIQNAISDIRWPKITPPPISMPSVPKLPTPSEQIKWYDPRTWSHNTMQTGRYQVPGRIGQPIPAILHGGERVIPHHEVDSHGGGGGNVINIYNPSVRNDGDIQKLANAVSEALAQKQKWARLGAY